MHLKRKQEMLCTEKLCNENFFFTITNVNTRTKMIAQFFSLGMNDEIGAVRYPRWCAGGWLGKRGHIDVPLGKM